MVKIAVFASGNGSNFENLVLKMKDGLLKGDIVFLIVDKKNAFALERAKKLGIEAIFIDPKSFSSKEEHEKEIVSNLKERDIKFIALAGYMRIIGETLLKEYEGRIVNIHPSYLPELKGKDSIKRAFEAKKDFTGVTVHFVDSGVDTGKVIYQEKIVIDKKWSLEELEEEVHEREHKIYPKALNLIFDKENF